MDLKKGLLHEVGCHDVAKAHVSLADVSIQDGRLQYSPLILDNVPGGGKNSVLII